jgi:hypothetical protein
MNKNYKVVCLIFLLRLYFYKKNLILFLMKKIVLILFLLISLGCSSLKEVSFKNYVDTTTKNINKQKKVIYSIVDIGVYASNC